MLQVELPLAAAPPPVYAPVKNLVMYVDMQCPLRCEYCFVEKVSRRMSLETARQAVDFLLDKRVSGLESRVDISFFGGEPLLALDVIEDTVAYARRRRPNSYKKISFGATTSGVLATPRIERLLKDSQMQLLISMDGGAEASSYRPYASGRSSYATVARNLPKLVSWARQAFVRMTFHPGALDLVANVRQGLELGAPSIALCPVVEADWSGHEERLEAAYDELAEWFLTEFKAGRVPPLDITWELLRQRATPACCGGARPARPCSVGHGLLAVDVEGQVLPCHRFVGQSDRRIGHVSSPVLSEDRMQYVHLSSRDILGCDTCMAERLCGGGCRVVALSGGYGLTGKHPSHCLLMRAHARAVYKIYDSLHRDQAFVRALRQGQPMPGILSELASSGG